MNREKKLFELSKQRYSDIINTFEQLPFAGDSKPKCFIYGDGLTQQLEKLFYDNFPVPAVKLVSNEKEKSDSGLEAIQVLFE